MGSDMEVETFTNFEAYGFAAIGVALSVLIPVVTRAVSQALPTPTTGLVTVESGSQTAALWAFAKPYGLVAIMSLLVAILIVAFVDFSDWKAALIGGYAWDATLQKIRRGSSET